MATVERVDTLNELSLLYGDANIDKQKILPEEALELAVKIEYEEGKTLP